MIELELLQRRIHAWAGDGGDRPQEGQKNIFNASENEYSDTKLIV